MTMRYDPTMSPRRAPRPRRGPATRVRSFVCPDDMWQRLDTYGALMDVSTSTVIRDALESYLDALDAAAGAKRSQAV